LVPSLLVDKLFKIGVGIDKVRKRALSGVSEITEVGIQRPILHMASGLFQVDRGASKQSDIELGRIETFTADKIADGDFMASAL
jgi:hypothetical protein